MFSPNNPLPAHQKAGFFLPSPDLSVYVRYYWKMADPNVHEQHKQARISPSGFPELIFHFGDPVLIGFQNDATDVVPRAMIAGQITRSINLMFSNSLHCFCVKLMPYALRALFNFNSSEFTNQAADLDCAAPSDYPGLYYRLRCNPGDRERITAIEEFLRHRLKMNRNCIHPVSEYFVKLVHSRTGIPFKTVMNEMGGSQRTLERKLKHDIGLTPKKFHRIVRFNKAYADIKNNPGLRLQDVVFHHGYYDQSHFVNEFREFTGSTPFRYFRNEDNYNQFFAGV